MLADRDEMLRQGNMPGVFKTADPGISIFYKTDGERKPVYIRILSLIHISEPTRH